MHLSGFSLTCIFLDKGINQSLYVSCGYTSKSYMSSQTLNLERGHQNTREKPPKQRNKTRRLASIFFFAPVPSIQSMKPTYFSSSQKLVSTQFELRVLTCMHIGIFLDLEPCILIMCLFCFTDKGHADRIFPQLSSHIIKSNDQHHINNAKSGENVTVKCLMVDFSTYRTFNAAAIVACWMHFSGVVLSAF